MTSTTTAIAPADPTTDPTSPPPTVPAHGYTTTEFWSTLLTNLLAVFVAVFSIVDPRFDLSGVQALIPAISVLAAAAATAWYSHSRGTVKTAALAASAQGALIRVR